MIVLDTVKPKLSFTIHLSGATILVLTLLDSKACKLAGWVEHEKTARTNSRCCWR